MSEELVVKRIVRGITVVTIIYQGLVWASLMALVYQLANMDWSHGVQGVLLCIWKGCNP